MTATGHDRPAVVAACGDATAAALIAERDFLFSSLADLDAEHAAGELSDDRYRQLHDRYTVQTATVLRALERLAANPAPQPTPPSRRRRHLLVTTVAIVVIAGTGAALLSRATGDRMAGMSITGNAQSMTGNAQPTTADLDTLARAARDRPGDPGTQLAYASAALDAGKLVDALKAFDVAARLDPANPAPRAYGGWILSLAGLTDQALARLDAAVAFDPTYPVARFFRGMVLLRGRGDQTAALAELREYLRLVPNGPERDEVQALVASLEAPMSTTTVAR